MLCATVSGPSFVDAQQQILNSLHLVDIIELRIDLIDQLHDHELMTLMAMAKEPILTFRKRQDMSRAQWIKKIHSLTKFSPKWIDIDLSFPKATLKAILMRNPRIKLILSYHTDKNEDLKAIYNEMLLTPAEIYKIVVSPLNSSEALNYIKKARSFCKKSTVLGLGTYGLPSRILSPFIGNAINYAAAICAPQAVEGQPKLEELLSYNYSQLSETLNIYGLIGNPITNSISNITHNFLFSRLSLNATYIKIPVALNEVDTFFSLIRDLPFSGLSVTMPLKTAILPYVDYLHESASLCKAINTLVFQNQKIIGYNTDGEGVFQLLKRKNISVDKKQIAIVGAGGSAKAIASVLATQGADIHIFNRTVASGKVLAALCKGRAHTLDSLLNFNTADIIINCLPPEVIFPWIFPPIVMDINTKPYPSLYLQHAKKKGSFVIHGYEMFIEQALLQFALWIPNALNSKNCDFFRNYVKNYLAKV
ncbi:Shikimate dehydrogenase,bifunctional 3-dehydroquinate dehydratase/shikimate dehydrogenase protein,5-enolpyruvylshikimate-3-phosphate synthase,shikimate 5-dehydrogenase,Type I 3-dehydroquinase [Chlamydia serpentis]|uniref:Shikimate dehydrogenase (NADP(+)) n=1 Tax=Chlamydia serpentis TaxID=1967782 RepID=A0A2R8FCJ1_9CHLA|nr:bifunctional 3-dehydroquinate dehydratase/shikimate dehydrogenase [Chlamydia serpentis]SPN74139.1 Shikimate dehydrogenase,bifunctional 3-dehydroquinate dehydratase/shikimate dehydrogenase protein,5-enolpyruvylshikimate-3-phosphate synthase,shikimate 5-dehydrogenase,Type I 3-dehydroquinase [Chlamydia serpentis]